MSEINIIEIIKMFNSSNIYELNLENKDFKLSVKKKNEELILSEPQKSENSQLAIDTVNQKDINCVEIKSPQVGTIISLDCVSGKENRCKEIKVKKGEVLCIIEAMKMMNEVVAPIDGTIQSIMVEENQIVEYGQVLFEIEEN